MSIYYLSIYSSITMHVFTFLIFFLLALIPSKFFQFILLLIFQFKPLNILLVFYFYLIHVIKFFWVPLWLLKFCFLWHSFPLSGLRLCFFSDVWRSWCIFISEEERPTYPAPPHINLELAHSALDWQVQFLLFPIGMGMITGKCEPTGKSLSWGLDLDIVRTH